MTSGHLGFPLAMQALPSHKCPVCPDHPLLQQGDDSFPVCHVCGYTSNTASSFFDEREEMLQQVDAAERYTGLLKDNTLGGARVLKDKDGRAFEGQSEIKKQVYHQARRRDMQTWISQLATVKLNLPDYIASRAFHTYETLAESASKSKRSITDKYAAAASVMICAAENNKIVNELEVTSVSGLDLDHFKEHLAQYRKELKVKYDSSIQATAHIETIIRHIKAVIESPDSSRVHQPTAPYPDEVIAFLHACYPLLIDIRHLSTQISEMLASLSVNYARNPGISASAIVYAAMEGASGRYLSLNGCIFDELASILPKGSTFTIRERYLEMLNVIFDLAQYLGQIGKRPTSVPAWRQMSNRPPPRRHLFVALLPIVVQNWRALVDAQVKSGKPAVKVLGKGMTGDKLWDLLFPGVEKPSKPPPSGPVQDKTASASTASTTGESEASSSQKKRRQTGLPEAERKARREEQERARRKRARLKNYGVIGQVELENAGTMSSSSQSVVTGKTDPHDQPLVSTFHSGSDTPLPIPLLSPRTLHPSPETLATAVAAAGPSSSSVNQGTHERALERRDIYLKNRAMYQRKRPGLEAMDYKRLKNRDRSVVKVLKEWQEQHQGQQDVGPGGDGGGSLEDPPLESTNAPSSTLEIQGAHLRRWLLSTTDYQSIPSSIFPSSALQARAMLRGFKSVDDLAEEELFEQGELEDYMCTEQEAGLKMKQWDGDETG